MSNGDEEDRVWSVTFVEDETDVQCFELIEFYQALHPARTADLFVRNE